MEFTVRYGNSDPDFRDDESWPWGNGATFPTWDAARQALLLYFEEWSDGNDSCPYCVARSREVVPIVRDATPETWDCEEIWVDGYEYWIEQVPVREPAR